MKSPWSVYLLACGDGTLYCGIALDVAVRLEAHRAGKGAKYTKGRGPLELVYAEPCSSRSEALRREREIKRMGRQAKLALAGRVDQKPLARQRRTSSSRESSREGSVAAMKMES